MTCDYKCKENDNGECKLGLTNISKTFHNEVEAYLYKHIFGAPDCVMFYESQEAKK